jgi:hypothetical protein
MQLLQHPSHGAGGILDDDPDPGSARHLGQVVGHQDAPGPGAAKRIQVLARRKERKVAGAGPIERGETRQEDGAVADQATTGQIGDGAGRQDTGVHAVVSWFAATAVRPAE